MVSLRLIAIPTREQALSKTVAAANLRVRAGVPLVSLVHPLIDRGVGEEIGGDWPRNNDRVYDVVIPGA